MEDIVIDGAGSVDEMVIELRRAARHFDDAGSTGFALVELFDENGALKQRDVVKNIITDAGDLYICQKGIVGISPANATAPTAMSGMKLGTGSTAVAKSGAGAALVTYLTASNIVFDATYPQTVNLGAGLGVTMVYKCTWGAGVATSASINEVVIVNDAATNATSSAANTSSRLVPVVNKGALDTLAITWSHKQLG